MIEEPKIDAATGLPYYDHLPDRFRKATRADLQGGYFKHKAPYLLQSFHNGNYYPRRVNISLNKADLPWLEAGRMWIYKP